MKLSFEKFRNEKGIVIAPSDAELEKFADEQTDLTDEEYNTLEADVPTSVIEHGLKHLRLRPTRGRVVTKVKNQFGYDSGFTITCDEICGKTVLTVHCPAHGQPIHTTIIHGHQEEVSISAKIIKLDGEKIVEKQISTTE